MVYLKFHEFFESGKKNIFKLFFANPIIIPCIDLKKGHFYHIKKVIN